MIATLEFLVKRFETFNHAFFDGALPPVPIKLGRAVRSLGSCTYKKRRKLFGKLEYYDFCLHISTRYDLPEEELEDILLHEMIHYEILVNQRQDTSAHGRLFRARMKQFNEQYGRHISVSHRHALLPVATPKDRRPQVVALVQMKNGRIGVKRLPASPQRSESPQMALPRSESPQMALLRSESPQMLLPRRDMQRIYAYRRGLLRSGEVASVDFYLTDDPYFLRFPKSSALNIFFPADPDLTAHFTAARLLAF